MTAQATAPAPPAPARMGGCPAPADTHLPAAIRHGALEAWLCALLTALLGRLEPIAHLLPGNACYPATTDDESRRAIRAVIRAANRLRAWIGWILRLTPHRAMGRTFAPLAPPAPVRSARAPPHARARNPPISVSEAPLPAAMTRAKSR